MVEKYDQNDNGYLSYAERMAVHRCFCSGQEISDLTGIEYFTALTELDCMGNQLTVLDLSQNTNLTKLYCYDNQLTELDVSAVPAIRDAVVNGTKDDTNSKYVRFFSESGTLLVDKEVTLITEAAAGATVTDNAGSHGSSSTAEDVNQSAIRTGADVK